MKRVLLALAALGLWLPAFAEAAPYVRHAVAAKARVCRAGRVRLGGGLCCPRSGVTRYGGCVSGALWPGSVTPPLRRQASPTAPRVPLAKNLEPVVPALASPGLSTLTPPLAMPHLTTPYSPSIVSPAPGPHF